MVSTATHPTCRRRPRDALDQADVQPFKEIWENRDCYGYNIRDENAPWYKRVWQTIVHSFGDLTPISVSSAQRAVDTGGTWSKDAVLAVLGFGPAPSYAERSTIQNRISFL